MTRMMAFWRRTSILFMLFVSTHARATESCTNAMRASVEHEFELDLSENAIRWKGDLLWKMNPKDFSFNHFFLRLLAENENVVFTANQIFEMAYPDDVTTTLAGREKYVWNAYVRIKRAFLRVDSQFYHLICDREFQGYVWCDEDPKSSRYTKIGDLTLTSQEVFWKEHALPELAPAPSGFQNRQRRLLFMLIEQPDKRVTLNAVVAAIWPKTQFASDKEAAIAIGKLANKLRRPFRQKDKAFRQVHLRDGQLSWNRQPVIRKAFVKKLKTEKTDLRQMKFSFEGREFGLTPRSGSLLCTILRFSRRYVSKDLFLESLAELEPVEDRITLPAMFAALRKELAQQQIPTDRIKQFRIYGAKWMGLTKPEIISIVLRNP